MTGLIKRLTAIVAAAFIAVSSVGAPAAAQSPDIKQLKLTEAHIKGFIGAQADLVAIAPKLQEAGDKLSPALQAELEQLAKKNGFASFAELDDVAANISMVMAGLDPNSGAYIDPAEAIKKEMDEVEKDNSIPEKDKKQMMEEMQEALKSTPPLQFKENIELVKKNQKDIDKAMQ